MLGRDFRFVGSERHVHIRFGDGEGNPFNGPIKLTFLDKNTMAVLSKDSSIHIQKVTGGVQRVFIAVSQKEAMEQKLAKESDGADPADAEWQLKFLSKYTNEGQRSDEPTRYGYIDLIPTDLCAVPGSTFISTTNETHNVKTFDVKEANDGVIQYKYGKYGHKPADFSEPLSLCCLQLPGKRRRRVTLVNSASQPLRKNNYNYHFMDAPSSYLYCVGEGGNNQRVQIFNQNYELLTSIGELGPSLGQFRDPVSIACRLPNRPPVRKRRRKKKSLRPARSESGVLLPDVFAGAAAGLPSDSKVTLSREEIYVEGEEEEEMEGEEEEDWLTKPYDPEWFKGCCDLYELEDMLYDENVSGNFVVARRPDPHLATLIPADAAVAMVPAAGEKGAAVDGAPDAHPTFAQSYDTWDTLSSAGLAEGSFNPFPSPSRDSTSGVNIDGVKIPMRAKSGAVSWSGVRISQSSEGDTAGSSSMVSGSATGPTRSATTTATATSTAADTVASVLSRSGRVDSTGASIPRSWSGSRGSAKSVPPPPPPPAEVIYDLLYITEAKKLAHRIIKQDEETKQYYMVNHLADEVNTFPSLWELVRKSKELKSGKDKREYALLAVVDRGNFRVQVFRVFWTKSEVYKPSIDMYRVIGGVRNSVHELVRPVSVAFSNTGELAVCDAGAKRVILFSSNFDVIKYIELPFVSEYSKLLAEKRKAEAVQAEMKGPGRIILPSIDRSQEANAALEAKNQAIVSGTNLSPAAAVPLETRPCCVAFSPEGYLTIGYRNGGIFVHKPYKNYQVGQLQNIQTSIFEIIVTEYLDYDDLCSLRSTCICLHSFTRELRLAWRIFPQGRRPRVNAAIYLFLRWGRVGEDGGCTLLSHTGQQLFPMVKDRQGREICRRYMMCSCSGSALKIPEPTPIGNFRIPRPASPVKTPETSTVDFAAECDSTEANSRKPLSWRLRMGAGGRGRGREGRVSGGGDSGAGAAGAALRSKTGLLGRKQRKLTSEERAAKRFAATFLTCKENHADIHYERQDLHRTGAYLLFEDFEYFLSLFYGVKFVWSFELYMKELYNAYAVERDILCRRDPMTRKNEIRRETATTTVRVLYYLQYLELMTVIEEHHCGFKDIHDHKLFRKLGRNRFLPPYPFDLESIDKRLYRDTTEQYEGGIDVPFKPHRGYHFLTRNGMERAEKELAHESKMKAHISIFEEKANNAAAKINSLFS